MYGAIFRPTLSRWWPLAVRPGDRVRILYGPMAGTRGTVIRLGDRHRCVLNIDGQDEDVHVILPADEVRRSRS